MDKKNRPTGRYVYEQNPYYPSNSSKQHHRLSAREERAYETFTKKFGNMLKHIVLAVKLGL